MKTILGDAFGLSGAVFSDDERYRYRLWRNFVVDPKSRCLFVMLNPSVADAFVLDPTVCRCVAFAKRWGHDALDVANLFALRSTDPKALYSAADPVGPDNDAALVDVARGAARIILAWGNHGAHLGRAARVLELLQFAKVVEPEVLKVTGEGMPGHPLYVAGKTAPTRASIFKLWRAA